MKALFSLLGLCLFASLVAASINTRRLPASTADIQKGVMWNGGKSRGAFHVTSPQGAKPLPSDREVAIEVQLDFYQSCEALAVRMRGLDGVQILSRARFQNLSCETGTPLRLPLKVRLPAGTRGFVAVDVGWGSKHEKRWETRTLPLQDEAAARTPLEPLKPMEVSNGEAVHIFQAESLDPHAPDRESESR